MNAFPPFPLADDAAHLPFVVDTADVADLDVEFAYLIRNAEKETGPLVVETSASNFEVLVPNSLQSCPMWVVWLPDAFASDVGQFVTCRPRVWEVTTVDLSKRWATLEWESDTHCVCVQALAVNSSIGWANTNGGRVVVAFVTPSRTSISTVVVDDDLVLDLQIRGARCDGNYRPVREHSDEDFAAAAALSALVGNMPSDNFFGKKSVHPSGRSYLYDQPRTW